MNATIEIQQPPPIFFSVGKITGFDFVLVLELIVMPSLGIAVASFAVGPNYKHGKLAVSDSTTRGIREAIKPVLGKHVIDESNLMLAVVEAVKEGKRRAKDAQVRMSAKHGSSFEASETIEVGSFTE